MPNALVIDISHHQPDPDWKALKKGGTIGVILKATEGSSYVDPTYGKRNVEARAAGLCVATYHFLKPGDTAASQMDFYVKTVKPKDGDRLIIDYEANGLKISDLETAIKRLAQIAPKCEISVYGANGFLGAQLGGARNDVLASTSLWIASYTSASVPTNRDLKGTWPVWSLWQYSDKGRVDGLDVNVDVNRWNGDPDKLPGWFNSSLMPEETVTPVPPTPPVTTQPVVIEIKVPEGVSVVTVVNGKMLA
ncbi:glycoside hydrolase family 25 protein [Rhizobium phage RHph_TM3_14A]|nr:glycoside hydrolase family 25 protein [Rhizobium phage RHph_TM27A]QIG66924.1 glycoside hydrolase family 25 protein [Rhizobium phage RHph_TM27B]QIG67014.1 glycoside hydrolase family 25 protein [Rhizobium phage RHph_TM29]QIG67469.1 glycoside hydrolase family 25 protein [Rhizobium phage RHph_TM3_14A]